MTPRIDRPESQVDKARLLAFLAERESHKNSLVWSVYHGLKDRVARGDFDADNDAKEGA